jgi:hypothetical protein
MDCLCKSTCQLSGKCCACSDSRELSTLKRLPRSLNHLRNKSVFVCSDKYVDGKGQCKKTLLFWNDYCPNCKLYFTLKYRITNTLVYFVGSGYVSGVAIPIDVNIAEFIAQTRADLQARFPGEKISMGSLELPSL